MKIDITPPKATYLSMVGAAYLTMQFSGVFIGAFLLLFAFGDVESGDSCVWWFFLYSFTGFFATAIPTLIYSILLPKMVKMVLRITNNSFMITNLIITLIAMLVYIGFAIPQKVTPLQDPEMFWSLLCAVIPASLFGIYAVIKTQAQPEHGAYRDNDR